MRRAVLLLALTFVAAPAAAVAAPRSLRGAPADLDSAAAPSSQLRKVGERRVLGRRFLRYRQVVGGLPVLGSDTVVTDAAGSRGDLLVDGSRRIGGRPRRATVRRARAVAAAVRSAGGAPLRGRPRAEKAVMPAGMRWRTIWRVVVPTAPAGLYEVIVDARSARTLRVRDLVRRAPAQGLVFEPNPVVANGGRGSLEDSSPDSAFTDPDPDLYRTVNFDGSRLNGECLEGDFVWATLPGSDGPPAGLECAANADFTSFERSDEKFEAVMTYFHIDRAQEYVQESLNILGANNRQQKVHVNELLPGGPDEQDNSFYIPDAGGLGEGEIFLGTGGIDDGEDAEVITHEYGHAIQDNQVPGFGDTAEGGAMGEGFSDYLSAALSRTFSPYPPNAEFDACFAEWDSLGFGIAGDPPCLRRVDKNLTAAQVGPGTACNAEVHCAGEAWSGALWDIRAEVGEVLADRKIVESHFSLTPQADFHAGAQALIAAYQADAPAEVPFVRSLLLQRGLLDAQRLDDTPATATALGVPASRAGQLQSGRDNDDVYSVLLTAGRGVIFRLRPTGGQHDFDLRLLRPGAPSLAEPPLAQAETAGSSEDLAYKPTATGTHFLDVRAFQGTGSYTVTTLVDSDSDARADAEDNCPTALNPGQEDSDSDRTGDACDRFPDDPANDADKDGLAADEDNCPRAANRTQADWDADDRGDLCDRSSRVSLRRLSARGRRLRLRATLRPGLLGSRAVTVRVERRVCVRVRSRGRTRTRCRYRKVTTARRGRARSGGRVDFLVKLRRRGTYRFRATLSDRRYNRAKSGLLRRRVR